MPTNQGGGPIKYVATGPCPDSNAQLSLFVPETVLETISDRQRQRIALIQTEFAHRVSTLLSQAYAEIAEVVREGGREQE